MLNASPGEQSTNGEPTGGWTVIQVAAAAGAASCPPRTLDASTRIEARAKSLNTVVLQRCGRLAAGAAVG
jgi:hypothetical protein